MNLQPIEKRERGTGDILSVHSIFHTIQGEGPFCGTPAVFLRLAGCNLQCPSCDTDYTNNRSTLTLIQIACRILQADTQPWQEGRRHLVVITGGEPFRQELGPLINHLISMGYYVQIETNGTLPPAVDVWYEQDITMREGAYIVLSPKAGKMNLQTLKHACCLKYVGEAGDLAEDDGLPVNALRHPASPRLARPPLGWGRLIYLQPMDAKDETANRENLKAVINSCMAHGYVLQLQVHKIIEME